MCVENHMTGRLDLSLSTLDTHVVYFYSSTERSGPSAVDNFNEFNDVNFSGSLEDLVNTFDEKITKCFCNYEENVEKFAPVQVRTQEEIMNDCQ